MLYCGKQASWALGNLAADGPEAAGQLERLGAVQALAALMWRGADPLEGVPGTRAATQAAWAVSNLARYAPSKVDIVSCQKGVTPSCEINVGEGEKDILCQIKEVLGGSMSHRFSPGQV